MMDRFPLWVLTAILQCSALCGTEKLTTTGLAGKGFNYCMATTSSADNDDDTSSADNDDDDEGDKVLLSLYFNYF